MTAPKIRFTGPTTNIGSLVAIAKRRLEKLREQLKFRGPIFRSRLDLPNGAINFLVRESGIDEIRIKATAAVVNLGFNILRQSDFNNFLVADSPDSIPLRCLSFLDINHEAGETVPVVGLAAVSSKTRAFFADLGGSYRQALSSEQHTAKTRLSNIGAYYSDLFYAPYQRSGDRYGNTASASITSARGAIEERGFTTFPNPDFTKLVIPRAAAPAEFQAHISDAHFVCENDTLQAIYDNYAVFRVGADAHRVVTVAISELPAYWSATDAATITVTDVAEGQFIQSFVGIDGTEFPIYAPSPKVDFDNSELLNAYTLVGSYTILQRWDGTSEVRGGTTYYTGRWLVNYSLITTAFEVRLAVDYQFQDLRELVGTVEDVDLDYFVIRAERAAGYYISYHPPADPPTTNDSTVTEHIQGNGTFLVTKDLYTINPAPAPQSNMLVMSGNTLVKGVELPVSSRREYGTVGSAWAYTSAAYGYNMRLHSYDLVHTWDDVARSAAVTKDGVIPAAEYLRAGTYEVHYRFIAEIFPTTSSTISYDPSQDFMPEWVLTPTAGRPDPPDDAGGILVYPTTVGTFYQFTQVHERLWLDDTLIDTGVFAGLAAPPPAANAVSFSAGSYSTGGEAYRSNSTGPSSPWSDHVFDSFATSNDVPATINDVLGAAGYGILLEDDIVVKNYTGSVIMAGNLGDLPFMGTPDDTRITIFAPELTPGSDGVCIAYVDGPDIVAFKAAYEARETSPAQDPPTDLSAYYTIGLNNFAPRSLIEFCLAIADGLDKHFHLFDPPPTPEADITNTYTPSIVYFGTFFSSERDIGASFEDTPFVSNSSGFNIGWELVTAPAGATINEEDGTVTWPSVTGGSHQFIVQATSFTTSSTHSWTITGV